MFLIDNSVLVNACRGEQPDHAKAIVWLEGALSGTEQVALLDQVIIGALRVVTNTRVFQEAMPTELALRFLEEVTSSRAVIRVTPSMRCVSQVLAWSTRLPVTGDRVPDAYLAAAALELEATLVTFDRGFGRYPGLKWMRPGDDSIRINPTLQV